jgi:hypothetical protein
VGARTRPSSAAQRGDRGSAARALSKDCTSANVAVNAELEEQERSRARVAEQPLDDPSDSAATAERRAGDPGANLQRRRRLVSHATPRKDDFRHYRRVIVPNCAARRRQRAVPVVSSPGVPQPTPTPLRAVSILSKASTSTTAPNQREMDENEDPGATVLLTATAKARRAIAVITERATVAC